MGLGDNQYGQTPFDEDERSELIPWWITTNAQLNRVEQENINAAIQFFARKKLDPMKMLSIPFIQKLHRKMFGDVWRWAGNFRATDKSIGVCKTEIFNRLYALFDDVKYWLVHETFEIDETVIRCKHRLVYVHPFVNGNGRHSRMFADLLITQLARKPFSWGKGLANPREVYLKALQKADGHDYLPLTTFSRQ